MPFEARPADEIRDDLLAQWAASYRSRGEDLAIDRDSHAYAEADALALQLEGLEIAAQSNALQVLVRNASGGRLDDFARDDGTTRKAAVAARRHVSVSGGTSTTTSVGGAYLTTSSGLRFDPIDSTGAALSSITTDGSGVAEILVECETEGPRGSIATGTVLTWSSAPSGFASTGTVTSTTTSRREGALVEGDEALRLRLLDRRRERPASGNRADWREKVREVTGVAEAYVYPLAMPPASYPDPSTPSTLGCVTVLAIGPTSGDAVVNTRFVVGGATGPGEQCDQIEDFLEGDRDADLNVTTLGRQWRPVTVPRGNCCVKTPRKLTQDVTLITVLSSARPYPWTYDASITVDGASLTSSLKVAGNHTTKAGKSALVRVGTSLIRGGYQSITLGSASYSGGVTTFDQSADEMLAIPTTGSVLLPAPPDWSSIRTSVFAFFDALGPGEYTGSPSDSARWPSTLDGGPSTVYGDAIGARVISDVPAVLSSVATTPASAVVPLDEEMVDIGYLVVHA